MILLQNSARSLTIWFCAFYSLFVIYGSLVPLKFNGDSFSVAMQAFLQLRFLDFGIVNRSDWFTNYLLFIPLSYGLLFINPIWKSWAGFALKFLCILLLLMIMSVVIEFCQMFIPARVSSFKDVFAQFLGVFTGLILFCTTHRQAENLLQKLLNGRKREKWLNYATGLIIVFTVYNLMPLDLSISPAEVYNKWVAGKINLLPFVPDTQFIAPYLFGIITDAAAWGVIGFCYLKSQKYSYSVILFRCLLIAVCVEFMQLFVLSRYTDITDIFTAVIGVLASIQLYSLLNSQIESVPDGKNLQHSFRILSVESSLLVWCVLLLLFALYPAELIQSKSQLVYKWKAFFSVPLETYWQGSAYSAITQLMRKVILIIPLGLLVTAMSIKYQLSKKYFIVFITIAIGYIVCLELLQLVLVSKVAVLTDIVLNLFGLFIGYKLYLKHAAHVFPSASSNDGVSASKIWPLKMPLSFLIMYVSLLFIEGFEKTPYNVKELFDEYSVVISAALITLVIFFTMSFPNILVSRLIAKDKLNLPILIVAPFLHCFMLFNLFYLTFPIESIHDILGYPVWKGTPHYIELCYRFLGFFVFISSAFFIVASRLNSTPSLSVKSVRWGFNIFFVLVILPLSFYVVVVQAGTDNVTELLRNNGYSINLLAMVVYFLMTVSLGFRWLPQYRPASPLIVSLLFLLTITSGFLGFLLVQFSLQDVVIKYGQGFSALQFLLSPSRDQLLNENYLIATFVALHFGFLMAIYAINWSVSSLWFVESKEEPTRPTFARKIV